MAALIDREVGGWELVRSLRPALREQVVLFKEIRDPNMPPGRVHMVDQLHLGGAFQDNRVVGYEGATGKEFNAGERHKLLTLVDIFLSPLPAGPRSVRLAEVEKHLDGTSTATTYSTSTTRITTTGRAPTFGNQARDELITRAAG